MNIPKPTAFSYIRFSTPEQALGDSERRQIDAAQRYADQHGLELDTRTFRDHGVSAFRGKNAKMGALRALLRQAEDGDIPAGSYLIVESMDRLSRTIPRKAVKTLEALCEAGLTVVTLDDGQVYTEARLDKEPYAFMVVYMVAIRANEESLRKGRRVAEAWAAKRGRADSEKLTAICPYWLHLKPTRKAFVVIEERAEIVRRIVQEALEGQGQERIARQLNEEGVKTFGRGERWYKSTIGKLLRSPALAGFYQPHKMAYGEDGVRQREPDGPLVAGYYPPVISEEDYARLQAGLDGKRAPYRRITHAITNPLAGIARCGLCGASMTQVAKGNRAKPRLVCSRAKVGAGCSYRSIPTEDIWAALRDPMLSADAPTGSDKSREQWEAIRRERMGAEVQLSNLANAIRDGVSASVLGPQISAAERSLKALNEQERAVEQRMLAETPHSVKRRLAALGAVLEDGDADAATVNRHLRENVSAIIIHPDMPEHMEAASMDVRWLHGGESSVAIGGFAAFPINPERK
ncbi:recombinase family protein [Rhizobium sp. Leaf453]|uniref:recombinase family protein n=1 Tax=Rhizobium sp. Leaf453 TaxID=1736380 RepID=UPI000715837B|nr:recombinase family protein [Rhizobium sp. Leaf453]KQU01688.1 hypothetical protein ASG68_08155 [Rhizobium sp. Leaf453]